MHYPPDDRGGPKMPMRAHMHICRLARGHALNVEVGRHTQQTASPFCEANTQKDKQGLPMLNALAIITVIIIISRQALSTC
jgi:hypothetical protein